MFRPHALRAASLSLLAAAAFGCNHATPQTTDATPEKSTASATTSGPSLELFVMSQCPYGVEAENGVIAAQKQLGGALNVRLAFIGSGKAGALESMHGPDEVKGDLAQICAQKLAPTKVLELVACMNQNPRGVGENWRDCAAKHDIDGAALAACTEGAMGQELLAASFAEADKRGATGSPTIFLAGKPYEGGRKGRDFARAACDAASPKPAACASLPTPPAVHAIFLGDKRCKECSMEGLEPRLRGELGGLVVERIDYGTDQGKALFEELHKENAMLLLPAVLFGADVEKDTDGYAELERFLMPIGKYKALAIGGQFDPTAEICGNGGDDDGDGAADCDDKDCKAEKECRELTPKTLDLFVMSQCPYGAQAMIGVQPVVEALGKDITLDVHFIGDSKGGELHSLHGPAEVAEDMRERCAVEKYRAKHQFVRYLSCRSANYRSSDWEPCAKQAGMDPKVIQACVDKDGKRLLEKDFALANSLHVDGSPTFLVNNRREFNAVEPSDIQAQYCTDNPGLLGCKTALAKAPASETNPGQQKDSCN